MNISLKWLLLILNFILVLLITLFVLLFVYVQEKKQLVSYLRGALEILVINGSLMFDGEDIKVLNKKEDWKTKEYEKVYDTLKKLYISNYEKGFEENHIYVVKPKIVGTNDSSNKEYIFAAHLPGDSSKPYHLGDIEKMQDPKINYIGDVYIGHPHFSFIIEKVLNKEWKVASTDIYEDPYGVWISAYAPVLDKKGNPVAVLEADYKIDFIYKSLYNAFFPVVLGLLIFSFLLFLLNFYVFKRILNPIWELVKATNAITNGDYKYRIPVINKFLKNEFDILKSYFNSMADSIEEKIYLSRYVSKDTIDKIRWESTEKKAFSNKEEKIIIFSDIRGFTNFSEQRDPQEVIYVLNFILGKQAEIIEESGGKIDKFVGDEIVALYDINIPIEKIFESIIKIFTDLQDILEFYKIGIGVGIHKGVLLQGDIGSKNRKDFTIIGASVNLCSRLCSGAKANEVLMTKEIFELLKYKFPISYKGKAKFKGFSVHIPVYSYVYSL